MTRLNEVLTYRWGVATVVLLVFAFLTKCDFHIGYKDFKTIFGLSLLHIKYLLSDSCPFQVKRIQR